mmetsp:Transcript_16719/g.32646  ORF Transcript_16719/g.32646 Transcript_16719/m.32646 type:complete len:278 (+) Transcript_16719:746-1579(+)
MDLGKRLYIRYFSTISMHSLILLRSPTVGPDAMVSRGSPTTSESTNDTHVAGYMLARNCPPFTRLRCFSTAFFSWIVHPLASRSFVTCCISSKLTPFLGAQSRDDPPPDMHTITRSRDLAICATASTDCVASTELLSGVGCFPRRTENWDGNPWPCSGISLVTTTLSSILDPMAWRMPLAIPMDALPNASTWMDSNSPRSATVFPWTTSFVVSVPRRARSTALMGSTASHAERKMDRAASLRPDSHPESFSSARAEDDTCRRDKLFWENSVPRGASS